MSIQDKFDRALALIQEHNEAIGGENQPGFVNPEKFTSCIKVQGGTTEERLKKFRYEDILQCLPEHEGVKPVLLAKDIAGVFRDTIDASEKQPVVPKKVKDMSIKALVEAFDPEDHTNKVGKRLAEIAKNQAFVVFSFGRTVDVDTTVALLMEIKQGYPGRDIMNVNGTPKKVYKLGELPSNFAEENPFYKRPLRPDGTCDQTNRSWAGIDQEVRQFVRVAVEKGDIKSDVEAIHHTLDLILNANDPLNALRIRYPQTSVKFDQLKELDNLPKLKIALGNKEVKNGPFNNGRTVVWDVAEMPNSNYYRATTNHK